MFTLIDTSETRKQSLANKYLSGYNLIALPHLERYTGADMAISKILPPSLTNESSTESELIRAYKFLAAYNAKFIQLKFGYDLFSSVGKDARLYRSLIKMKSIGCCNPQMILLWIAFYKETNGGKLSINGRRRKNATETLAMLRGIEDAWVDSGGAFHHIHSGNELPSRIQSFERSMKKKRTTNIYLNERFTELDTMSTADFSEALRSQRIVDDIRVVIASIKGIGPEKAQLIYDGLTVNGIGPDIDDIINFFKTDLIKIKGIGPVIKSNAKLFLYPNSD